MSIKIMSQIWENGPGSVTDRFVLLAIADYANDDGEAWPSIASIMKKTTLSERGVQTTIRRLEADNWLRIETGNGRHGCNKYHIKNPAADAPRTICPPHMKAETPHMTARNPAPGAPEPSRTIKEPSYSSSPVREAYATQDDFERFWATYPNKVQRPSAQGAYQFACLKATPREILTGAIRYARKTDDRPWMNPARWLAEECWNDMPAEPPPKRQTENPRMAAKNAAIERFLNGDGNGQSDENSVGGNVLVLPSKPGY
jgi:hypothetical protein